MSAYRRGFLHGLIAALVLAIVVGVCLGNPRASLLAAAADAAQAGPGARYVSLYHVPPAERPAELAALGLAVNLVSRAAVIVQPVEVPVPGRPAFELVRIDLGQLGIPLAVWESAIGSEPYWHLRTQILGADGKPQTVLTDGGWLDLEAAARLRAATASAGAIVRSDWLLARLVTTINGGLYYEFAGVTDFADVSALYRAYGVDFEATERLLVESWALVLRRGPTQKAGRVIRRQGAMGAAWKTEDLLAERPEVDPFREPLSRKHDGSEHFLTKANGLPLVLLADGKGKFVREAPPELAHDSTQAHGVPTLAPALSCIVCHAAGYLQPVANDFRALLDGPIEAWFAQPADAVKAAALYQRDLERHLERDRDDYERAARQASGLSVADSGQLTAAIYRAYAHEPVSPERAARELALPAGVSLGHVLAESRDLLLLALVEGRSIQRVQWEASFAEAALRAARHWE